VPGASRKRGDRLFLLVEGYLFRHSWGAGVQALSNGVALKPALYCPCAFMIVAIQDWRISPRNPEFVESGSLRSK